MNSDKPFEASPGFEIDLIGMLRRRWSQLVLGCVVGIALAALYYFSVTPMFESEIEILVGQRSSEVTNSGTITGANASGDAIQEDQLATHMRLLVSRRTLAEAIDTAQLRELKSFREAAARGTNLIDHILDHIQVDRGGEGNASDAMVLRAAFQDPNPDDAAVVLAAIYDRYRKYVESHGQNSTEQAVRLIEEARMTHEQELAAADADYRRFIKSVPVFVEGEKVRDVHKDRLASMEPELNLVRTSLAAASSRLAVIESYVDEQGDRKVGDMDHLALLSQKEVERLKLFLDMTRGEAQSEAFQAEQPVREEVAKVQYNRLLDLIQKEKAFSDAYGPGHPFVEAVRKETEITRRFIEANAPAETQKPTRKLDPADMLMTYTMLLRNDIAEFEKRKELLLGELETEMAKAKQVESDFLKGSALKAKLARAQARYDQVILRLQELNLARSYAGFSTDVLASPEAASSPVWPILPIILVLGCCFGLGIGLILAVAAELVDHTFGDPREIEQVVGAPAIAHVPNFDAKELAARVDADSQLDPSLVAFHAPRSSESEVYRVARTSLMISNRRGAVRTMMMTSPQPGDGKSTTISNLAVSFAGAGKRVLLIDGDLRRPVISALFGLAEEAGLADVLMGEADFEEAISASDVNGLDIMPNGLPTSVPAELLESPRLARLLDQAANHYDLILIDAPPLLAVADPAIIAPLVDSVILTVRISKNGRRPVEHAARILRDINVQPSAVVVNGIDSDAKSSYGYGGYSGDQYRYIGSFHGQYAATQVDEVEPRQVPRKSPPAPKGRSVAKPAPLPLPRTESSPPFTQSS